MITFLIAVPLGLWLLWSYQFSTGHLVFLLGIIFLVAEALLRRQTSI